MEAVEPLRNMGKVCRAEFQNPINSNLITDDSTVNTLRASLIAVWQGLKEHLWSAENNLARMCHHLQPFALPPQSSCLQNRPVLCMIKFFISSVLACSSLHCMPATHFLRSFCSLVARCQTESGDSRGGMSFGDLRSGLSLNVLFLIHSF